MLAVLLASISVILQLCFRHKQANEHRYFLTWHVYFQCVRHVRSRYNHWLGTGTVRGSNPGGGEIFRTGPDRPWCPPSLLYSGYWVSPGVKSGRGVTLTPHPLLVPWSRKSRAIPLIPLWAVRPVQSLSACKRVHFTLPTFVRHVPKCTSHTRVIPKSTSDWLVKINALS